MLENLFNVYKVFLSSLFVNDIGASALYLLMGVFCVVLCYRIVGGKF